MKKVLLITLIFLISLGFSASSQEGSHFMPQHWVLGTVSGDENVLPQTKGKTITLFNAQKPEEAITAQVGTDYRFAFNTFRLPSSWKAGDVLILKLEKFDAAGTTYAGINQITSQGTGYEHIVLAVKKESELKHGFIVTPNKLEFSNEQYLQLAPQTISITNVGETGINYTISKNEAWLKPAKTAGLLSPGQSENIQIVIDQDSETNPVWLNEGTYNDIITVSDASGIAESQLINIDLIITPPTNPPIPEVSQLKIERLPNDLKVAWNKKPNDLVVDIYVKTGPAASTEWEKLAAAPAGFELHLDANYFLHKNQVGQGENELYYTIVPKDADLDTVKNSPTVTKVNYLCEKGFNLVSFPFNFDGKDSLDEVIGDQLSNGSAKDADIIFDKKSAASFSYNWAYLNENGIWKNVDDSADPSFALSPLKGYFIWHQPPEAKTITIVGKVIKAWFIVNLEEGFSLIGNGSPIEINLKEAGFSNAYSAGAKDADILFKKKSPASFSYDWSFYAEDQEWHNADNSTELSQFKFSAFCGYYYWRRTGQGPLVWTKKLE